MPNEIEPTEDDTTTSDQAEPSLRNAGASVAEHTPAQDIGKFAPTSDNPY
ncbi:hypothetical protein ACIA6C_29665 [Streptomyces sp. NPDC051578]